MASRFFSSARLASRAVSRRTYATHHHDTTNAVFPEETFNANIWRNAVLAAIAGVAWYRIDQHITDLGEEKHPFTKWIEYHMTPAAEKDKFNNEALDRASQLAEYRLIAQDAQRAPVYRMRYPEAFERASPRGLVTGQQADLSDLKVRTD
ncbi:hypothetical protein BX666DRAFT_2030315 [Dichotomocladium elegans]|nr:hypothetical protein BX666DRAFT_2030315 [Dichotomocladium elegans]